MDVNLNLIVVLQHVVNLVKPNRLAVKVFSINIFIDHLVFIMFVLLRTILYHNLFYRIWIFNVNLVLIDMIFKIEDLVFFVIGSFGVVPFSNIPYLRWSRICFYRIFQCWSNGEFPPRISENTAAAWRSWGC